MKQNVPSSAALGSLFFVHGFLGQSRDGAFLKVPGWSLEALDLFSPQGFASEDYSFSSLSQRIHHRFTPSLELPRVLIAYSWGARVALHALLRQPQSYSGAVLIGAHPGLLDEEEKKLRVSSDERWADRFLSEDWKTLLQDWNSQSIFQSSFANENLRDESEFSRASLALALTNSSLGRQQDLRPFLRSLSIPTLWVVGGEDYKFKALYAELEALGLPKSHFVQIPHAGHRVHLDQPEALNQEVQKFLNRFQLSFKRDELPSEKRL